jgi:exonuclease SbcD
MLRLLHMADVHLGARHRDLGEAAARQRERQLAAFRRGIDVALERKVDVTLICGDLFDSNAQPLRTVQLAANELKRLTAVGGRVVLIPGTHDVYDASSLYRVFDLAQMCGLAPGSPLLTVLVPEGPDVVFPEFDVVVHARVFPTKRAPRSPLAGFDATADTRAAWHVGMIHGAIHIPGKVEQDEVMVTPAEIAASGLDYLALGHWHSFQQGRAGRTTWAYAGAPEPVAVDQDGAGQVLAVTLDEHDGDRSVTVEPVTVGRTRFRGIEVDAAAFASQGDLVASLKGLADPDVVLDVRICGVSGDSLEVSPADVVEQLAPAFLAVRVRDISTPALPDGPLPPPDTIAGAFIRDLAARIAAAEAGGASGMASEAREALRLGRLLLDDPRRVTLA